MKKTTPFLLFFAISILFPFAFVQAQSQDGINCKEQGYQVENGSLFYCNNAYEPKIEMMGVDLPSFKIISQYPQLDLAKDKAAVYCNENKVEADPQTLELIQGSYYFKDKDSVFFDCKKLEGADPIHFKIIDNGFFGQDGNNVYHREFPLDLEVQTLKVYGDSYLGDSSKVFFNNYLVQGADPASFKVIDPNDDYLYCGVGGIDARDKNNYYSNYNKVCDSSFDRIVSSFPDLNVGTDYIFSIVWTIQEGITKGYENGYWGPEDCVTRAQLLKMLLEYRFGESFDLYLAQLKIRENFSDVSPSDWHEKYVSYGLFLKIVEGYSNGTFQPNKCVNRVESMKMAVKTLLPGKEINASTPLSYWGNGPIMVDMSPTDWYAPYARFLFNYGLVGSNHTQEAKVENFDPNYYVEILGGLADNKRPLNFFPDQPMSRKEVAEMLFGINKHAKAKGIVYEKQESLLPKTPLESSYYSQSSQKTLPYFYLEPGQTIKPKGIFIYLHGAGGGYEQGMQDDHYAGNFKNLKEYLIKNNFVYATPETSGFGESAGVNVLEFIQHLNGKYGNLPIYLSGASAGGSTLFYSLNTLKDTNFDIQGTIFVVPAISTDTIDNMDWSTVPFSVWIEAGEKDAVFPPVRVTYFEQALIKKNYPVYTHVIPGGDHNAPVEQIDWSAAIAFLQNN